MCSMSTFFFSNEQHMSFPRPAYMSQDIFAKPVLLVFFNLDCDTIRNLIYGLGEIKSITIAPMIRYSSVRLVYISVFCR